LIRSQHRQNNVPTFGNQFGKFAFSPAPSPLGRLASPQLIETASDKERSRRYPINRCRNRRFLVDILRLHRRFLDHDNNNRHVLFSSTWNASLLALSHWVTWHFYSNVMRHFPVKCVISIANRTECLIKKMLLTFVGSTISTTMETTPEFFTSD
jgi:hypothetical protein